MAFQRNSFKFRGKQQKLWCRSEPKWNCEAMSECCDSLTPMPPRFTTCPKTITCRISPENTVDYKNEGGLLTSNCGVILYCSFLSHWPHLFFSVALTPSVLQEFRDSMNHDSTKESIPPRLMVTPTQPSLSAPKVPSALDRLSDQSLLPRTSLLQPISSHIFQSCQFSAGQCQAELQQG